MTVRSFVALATSSAALLALATPAVAGPLETAGAHEFVMLPALPGSTYTVPHGINPKGQLVGESHEAGTDVSHAVFWSLTGGLHDLAGGGARAWALNDNGLIVGNISWHPGYWQQGVWHAVTDIGNNRTVNAKGVMGGDHDTNLALFNKRGERLLGGLPQGFRDTAEGINLSLTEVGTSYMMVGWGIPPTLPHYHPDGQSTMQLPIPGNNGSAQAINDAGVIVGSSWQVDIDNHTTWRCALRWEQLQPTCLRWDDGFAGANALDSLGHVVGWGVAKDGRSHAVLWGPTGPVDLNDWMPAAWRDAGWVLTVANAINDAGAIAGEMIDTHGGTHAWLMRAPASPGL